MAVISFVQCSGIVGMALVAFGRDAVVWYDYDAGSLFPIKGITSVVISWVFSPVASGIVAALFFLVARTLILRAEDSYSKAFFFLPVLVGITAFINAFYVLDKGIAKQWKWLKNDGGTAASAGIAAAIGGVFILLGVGFSYWLKPRVDAQIKNGTLAADVESKGKESAGEESMFPLLCRMPSASGKKCHHLSTVHIGKHATPSKMDACV